jgi:hypothetical protein
VGFGEEWIREEKRKRIHEGVANVHAKVLWKRIKRLTLTLYSSYRYNWKIIDEIIKSISCICSIISLLYKFHKKKISSI